MAELDSRRHLVAEARAWIADDPDPTTRAELERLVADGDLAALEERFAGPLQFGTAGLRGIIGAGPSRMNVATVARVAAGLARQLLADVPGARERGVCIGRDGRRMSPELARVAAEVLAGHGLRVWWVPDPAPTPLVAFAGRHLDAAGTGIVTASHNPPEYNGFKVYGPNGAQIVPPQDARIRAEADGAGAISALPRANFEEAVADGRITVLGDDIGAAFLDALDTQCLGPVPPPAPLRIVTTALHGVGHRWVAEALARRGFHDVHAVAAQAEPDGAFPTVRFPNPEEDGALDLALALARDVKADLVIANDPDTDRLSLSVRQDSAPEGYVPLTGDQVGVLLGDWILSEGRRLGRLPPRPLVATTCVSSTMLSRIAAHHHVDYGETLTGFKWLWRLALDRETRDGAAFVFGYEEALGYCVGPAVRDKDGVGAALTAAELAASLAAQGLTLLDRLDDLYRQHGAHVSRQVAVMLPGLEGKARIAAVIDQLRRERPTELAGDPVIEARDYSGPDAEAAGLPRSNVLTFWTEGGSRLVFRPSGTEPKLKCYLETTSEVAAGEAADTALARAAATADAIEAWIRAVVSSERP